MQIVPQMLFRNKLIRARNDALNEKHIENEICKKEWCIVKAQATKNDCFIRKSVDYTLHSI